MDFQQFSCKNNQWATIRHRINSIVFYESVRIMAKFDVIQVLGMYDSNDQV